MLARYANGYDAHHMQDTYPRARVQRIRTKKNSRALDEYERKCVRECVCTLRLGTTHISAARLPRGKHPRGSECFAAPRDLPPASATLLRSISPENPNILSGLSTLPLIHEIPAREESAKTSLPS